MWAAKGAGKNKINQALPKMLLPTLLCGCLSAAQMLTILDCHFALGSLQLFCSIDLTDLSFLVPVRIIHHLVSMLYTFESSIEDAVQKQTHARGSFNLQQFQPDNSI